MIIISYILLFAGLGVYFLTKDSSFVALGGLVGCTTAFYYCILWIKDIYDTMKLVIGEVRE